MLRFFELLYYYITNNIWGIIAAIISILTASASILRFYFKINDFESLVNLLKPKIKFLFNKIIKPIFELLYQIWNIIKCLFNSVLSKLAYKRNKWIYNAFFILILIVFFSYKFTKFYIEKNKFKVCILYSYETEMFGFKETTKNIIDSIFTKNNVSFISDYVQVEYNVDLKLKKKYDIILTILPIRQSIESIYSIRSNNNTIIIDLLSHSIKLPLDRKISNFYNLKYEPYDDEIIIALDKIIGKSKALFILSNGNYQSLIKENNKRVIRLSYQDYINDIRGIIYNYDTIAVDYIYKIEQVKQIDKICLENKKKLTLIVLNNNLTEERNCKLNMLDLISMVPSKDSIFYSNYSKIMKFRDKNAKIYNYLLSNYLSIVLNEVKKNGIYTFDITNLINKEINSSSGIIKFNDNLENIYLKPIFYNFRKKTFYE